MTFNPYNASNMSSRPYSGSSRVRGSPAGPSHKPPPATIDLSSLVNENQSIKIISPVDDIIIGGGVVLNSALDDNTKQWLDNIQHSWNLWKKSANTLNLLNRFFESVDNPFLSCLKLLVNYRGRADCRNNTLSYVTIEELKKWSSSRLPQILEILNLDTKVAAFNVAKEKRNVPFIKLVAETFHISDEDINCYVQEMLQEKQYNTVCHVIIAFNLRTQDVIDDLLFPLVLQDKTPLVDEYLTAYPDQAITFVEFLDSFLGSNGNFKDQIYNYLTAKKIIVSQIKWERIHHKAFGKLISRICNKYNISISLCTNLTNQRAVGGLRYLIHQRYNNSISDNAWNDMVVDAINENPQLITELITLVDHYNTRDACKWAKFFNYSEDLCPENMRLYMQLYMNKEDEEENTCTASTSQLVKYHSLSTDVNVVFVDTPQLFVEAVCNGISNECLVGIDSEWKPSFGTKKSTVSLIQISTKSAIFLFDALRLNDENSTELWCLLSKKVFENPNIIKLGFGIENDMREIRSSIPGLKLLKYKDFNFIEVQTLWKAVTNAGVKLPHKKENSGEGLSAIVQQCFGSSLKKHEQCSNWEIRPLRQSQIDYAALDAYVLLEIYNMFEMLCQNLNLNIEDVCNRVRETADKSRMKKPKRKNNEKYINCNTGPNSTPILPGATKLLLETCLGILAKYLRCCGIDVDIISENESWDESVQRAVKEKRYIVIKYFNSKKVSKLIPRNHVYILESCYIEEQLKEVLYYFNIKMLSPSLFSRCDICNRDDVTVIPQDVMKKMKTTPKLESSSNERSSEKSVTILQQHSYNHSDDEYDDYDGFLSDKEDDDDLVLVVKDLVLSPENIDVGRCLTKCRVDIQIEDITNKILDDNVEFYVCQQCGKCFYRNGYLPDNLLNVILYMMSTLS